MNKIISFGKNLPKPFKKFSLPFLINLTNFLGINYFEWDYKGKKIKFGYFDKKTYNKAKNMMDDGKIFHETIDLKYLFIPEDRDAALDMGGYFGVYTIVVGVLNSNLPLYVFEPDHYNFKVLKLNFNSILLNLIYTYYLSKILFV